MILRARVKMRIMRASSEISDEREVRERLASLRTLVEARLDELIPAETVEPRNIHAAIRWSLFAGGKRFRSILLLATGEAFGASVDALLDTACALEMIHTYSLIHDDLPAMDNDDLRRGRPTCHVRYGDATAILAGDALLTLAFQTIAEDERLTPDIRMRLVNEIARASGTPEGMVAGQAHDLEAESRDVSGEELERIHRLKTGALVAASARSGAIIAGAHGAEKGAGLCHGTAGNGYALLKTFERTGDERWLERARKFAVHALAQAQGAPGRYSLFTGGVGVALFAAGCLEADPRFPVLDWL